MKLFFISILLGISFFAMAGKASAAADWLPDYSYRKPITLSRPDGAVTDYQMKLVVGESSGVTGEDIDLGALGQTDFDDLRFTNADGTLLDYWIESISGITPNQLATVWIEFDSIGTSATTFYMYYGNSGAAAYSNGSNTFLFFDDFSGDLSKWQGDTAAANISSGVMTLTATAAASKLLYPLAALSGDFDIRTRMNLKDMDYSGLYLMLVDVSQFMGISHNSSRTNHSDWSSHLTASSLKSQQAIGFGAFHNYGITRILTGTDTGKFYLDDILVASFDTEVPTADLYIIFDAYGTGDTVSADWVFARNIVSVEPTWGIWGGVESETYTVTFDSNDGSAVDPIIDVEENATVTLPTPPTKALNTFSGWFSDDTTFSVPFDEATPVTTDITVYAKWTADTYTVTFDSNDGSAVDPIIDVEENATVTLPTPPTKALNTFSGWFSDDTTFSVPFDEATPVTTDITVYAKWTADTYTVTFDKKGGLGTTDPITNVAYNATVTLPTPPTKALNTFAGWFSDDSTFSVPFTEATAVTADITVYAKWTANTYTVTFDKNGGSGTTDPITGVAYNATVTLPTDPTKALNTFAGWFSDDSTFLVPFTEATAVTADITVYAKWTANEEEPETYTVTFDSNGGSAVGAITDIVSGATIVLPANPTRDGYTFDGWFSDDTTFLIPFTEATEVAANITVYAKWTAEDDQIDINVHNVKAVSTENSITTTWKTDHHATSIVRYNLNRDLKQRQENKQKELSHKMTLTGLLPDTKYYFRIKSEGSGDNTDSSKIHSIKTQAAANSDGNLNQNAEQALVIPSYAGNVSPNVCSYSVESGDSLWSIAQKVYGDATAYPLIIEKNKEKYPNIASGLLIGQELTFGCSNENQDAVKGASDIRDDVGSNNPGTPNQESSSARLNSAKQAGGFKWWNPLTWF